MRRYNGRWPWWSRRDHLIKLGLATKEGWPRPNAPQFMRESEWRIDGLDEKPPRWFAVGVMVGICYRIRANTGLRISDAIWKRHDESRDMLKACIAQAEEAARLQHLRKS